MYLLIFDLIDSRKKKVILSDIIDIQNFITKFEIDGDKIEITGGDQIRLLSDKPQFLISIILECLAKLGEHGLKARVYVSTGHIERLDVPINEMQGDIFYKAKDLEINSKTEKVIKDNQIFYVGAEHTEELELLFNAFAKLVLHKPNYLNTVVCSVYLGMSQTAIAQELNMSQSSINNQLVKSNANLVLKYQKVIGKLIEEEVWTYNN